MAPFPSVFLSPLGDFAVSVQAAAKDNKIITDNKSPVVMSLIMVIELSGVQFGLKSYA